MIIANVRCFDPAMPKLEAIDNGDWIDVRACSVKVNGASHDFDESGVVHYKAGDFLLIGLGFALQCPDKHEAHIAPRSSTFKNFHLIQTNGVGVVDYSYRGNNDQWFVPMLAMKDGSIMKYDRVAQFRFIPKMCKLTLNEKVEFEDVVDRGGHGSTGTK